MGRVALAEVAEVVGTPTYLYHADVIRAQYRRLDEVFGDLPHRICYAVKANANLAVLRLLAQEGAGADIVSGGEMLRALTAGFAARDIVFSGVGKTDEELQAAITAGVGHINVESLSELARLATLAEALGIRVAIGVRVNPDVSAETHPYISTGQGGLKFGIPMDQFAEVLRMLEHTDSLLLESVAMHLGSQLLTVDPWVAGVDRLLTVLATARAAGHPVRVLDLGGGFGIRYRDETPLDPALLLAATRDRLAASGCEIRVEPGRHLVGSAGVLLTSVLHRKHSGGRDIVIVDAGMNDLLRPSLYKAWHHVVPVRGTGAAEQATDIVGPVCETGDFLALERPLEPVATGDLLAVLCAGAYAFVMSSNYNSRARAAEVLVEDNRWAVSRPRERLADLFRDEHPDPLAIEVT